MTTLSLASLNNAYHQFQLAVFLFLRYEEIAGQEDADRETGLEFDDEYLMGAKGHVRITPFNMRKELEEGVQSHSASTVSPLTNAHLPPMFCWALRSRGHIHIRRAPRPRARQLTRQRRLGGGHTHEAHRCRRRLCLGSSGGLTQLISHRERKAHTRRALPAHLRDASARRDGASNAPSGLSCSLTYSPFVHHFTLYVQFVYLLLYIICAYFTYGRENDKL